jgi:hypothetical protein
MKIGVLALVVCGGFAFGFAFITVLMVVDLLALLNGEDPLAGARAAGAFVIWSEP